MLGFETIGNATIIVHDRTPVLSTDPWIAGEPYFGSWGMSHYIPSEQLDRIHRSKYIWFSHGHPDHLNADSLHELSNKPILLPDHVGGRIERDLRRFGLNVHVLPTKQWVELSPNVRVMCLPDYNQDATLLIALGSALIVNLNDGAALGYKRFIRDLSRNFARRYVLALRNYGDADMLNLWDETGRFLAPPAAEKPSVGAMYEELVRRFDATHVMPFSCFHQYQRRDSIWAAAYSTPLAAHRDGFSTSKADLLPAFVQIDLEKDSILETNPPPCLAVVKDPEEFGDSWSDELEKGERRLCEKYFSQKSHLVKILGFINMKIGGKDNLVVLNKKKRSGITFECPRNSFFKAVQWEVFDDLLIGNFMRTTLHGIKSLYPDFTPFVAKYADNGRAQSPEELKSYFRAYSARSEREFLLTRFHQHADGIFRRLFSNQSEVFKLTSKLYHWVR
jgi:hypothetical protein